MLHLYNLRLTFGIVKCVVLSCACHVTFNTVVNPALNFLFPSKIILITEIPLLQLLTETRLISQYIAYFSDYIPQPIVNLI